MPLLMPHQKGSARFSMQSGIEFNEEEAIKVVKEFMEFYWESDMFPEVIYIQSSMPTILHYASDSTYARAMSSTEDMESFVEYLTRLQEQSANMDW